MDPHAEDNGGQSYVKMAELGGDEMELPGETDGTVLLSTVLAQFPGAIGLKYKSSSGAWRGIRAVDNVLDPPPGGWGDTTYYITEVDPLKRKTSSAISDEASAPEESAPEGSGTEGSGTEDSAPEDPAPEDSAPAAKSSKSSVTNHLLEDIIVLGLPYTTTEDELEEYFTKTCGELAFHEIKYKKNTKKSRGFGFIRFKTEDAAKEALNGEHELMGRKLEIRPSQRKVNPMKLFVGRLPAGTTQARLQEFFSEFGELTDVYVPTPFRNFGFVTFTSEEEARTVLGMEHELDGKPLNVGKADPKNNFTRKNRQQSNNQQSSNFSSNNNRNMSQQDRYDPRNMQGSSGGSDLATGLKNLLYAYLTGQR